MSLTQCADCSLLERIRARNIPFLRKRTYTDPASDDGLSVPAALTIGFEDDDLLLFTIRTETTQSADTAHGAAPAEKLGSDNLPTACASPR